LSYTKLADFPSKMEFPPENWDLFKAEEFETAIARSPGDVGVELMVQARPNGRVVDHWRLVTGGVRILDAKVKMAHMMVAAAGLPAWSISLQKWPADIELRRNMTTSNWTDLTDMLTSNEVTVANGEGEPVANEVVVEALAGLPNKAGNSASLRWAVQVNPAGKLELNLQCLPAPLHCLSKPLFKR